MGNISTVLISRSKKQEFPLQRFLVTYLHSIAETHCKEVSEAHTVLSVPLDWSREEDVDSVVMVGGSTKVVKLQNALANAFPDAEVLTSIPGDEVLAYGAAVHASLLTKEGTTEPNVSMMSISKDISARVVGLGGEDDEVEVVCADTPLPVKKSVPLAVTGESTSVEVLWGEDVLDTLSLAT